MENPIQMDDSEVPLFLETSKSWKKRNCLPKMWILCKGIYKSNPQKQPKYVDLIFWTLVSKLAIQSTWWFPNIFFEFLPLGKKIQFDYSHIFWNGLGWGSTTTLDISWPQKIPEISKKIHRECEC